MRERHELGSALVVGLWMLAILSLTSLGLAYRGRLALKTSGLSARKQEALYLCKAMTNRAISELMKDENEFDALNEPWAAHRSFLEEGWGVELGVDEAAWQRIEYSVWDESGKINVNLMPENYIANLKILEPAQAAAILDWIDEDDTPRPGGAESEYYSRLNPPGVARNAAIANLDELLSAKGITPELYLHGPAGEMQEGDINDGAASFRQGLRGFLTEYGDRQKININTAPAEVLAAISPALKEDTVEGIVERVRGADGVAGTADDEPFTNIDELESVYGISDYEASLLRAACSVQSNYFSIYCRATSIGGVTKSTRAVVGRDVESKKVWTVAWREY